MIAERSLSSEEKRSLLVKLLQGVLRGSAPAVLMASKSTGLERFSISTAMLKSDAALDPSVLRAPAV